MKRLYEKLRSKLPRAAKAIDAHKSGLMILAYALQISVILYYCLEIGNRNFFFNGIFYTFINIILVFVLQSAVYLIVHRWWLASSVIAVPVTLLSIANNYTIQFRNLPISPQDIHNVKTTLAVIGGYKFKINLYIIPIAILVIVCVAVIKKLYALEKGRKTEWKREIIKSACLLLCGPLFVYGCFFGKKPIMPKDTFLWSWVDTYNRYGYIASSVEVFRKSQNVVHKPEGYAPENIAYLVEEKAECEDPRTPDIILILNETFFDLRDVMDIETDVEFMPFIDNLEGAVTGRAVVTGMGGETNKSEYELLTSNSLQHMPGITPFHYLNFDGANSVVSFLEELGYTTWSGHCAPSSNYARGSVYPKLGFDTVKFNKDFSADFYGKRFYATDSSCYKTLINDYEKMGENPRFMYMLTIQNHGGWELNNEKMDTVHSLSDFGSYTDDINEYLTCIRMADKAFEELVNHFSTSERPVIICMLGDHAPAFVPEMVKERDKETVIKLCSTPFVVWSNFDMKEWQSTEISIPMMVPKVLETAGVPLSPFYSYMLELSRELPVVTASNMCRDKNGEIHYYNTPGFPYKEETDTYFDLVYNNVGPVKERIDELFMPVK